MKQQSGWKLGVVIVGLLIVATAVACSGNEGSSGRPGASSTVAPASPAPTQSPAAATDDEATTASVKREELKAVFEQIGDIGGVELKLVVDDSERQNAMHSLDMDPLEGQLRQTTFFDTKDLILTNAGVVVRLRRVQGKPASSTIKLRPIKPSQVTPQLRSVPGLSIELDVMPDRFICSASLVQENVDDKLAKDVIAQRKPIRELFSEQQRAFYKEHAPQGLDLDSLHVLGPINIVLLKFKPAGLDRQLIAELWTYPDGSRVLELSVKCKPSEAGEVAKTTMAFLNSHGVKASLVQKTKARQALEYFSKMQ